MFARVVECTVKPEKTQDFSRLINNEILPILRRQSGFVDEITLVSESDREKVLAISFWGTKEEADRYNREQFPKISETLRPVLRSNPEVHTFHVDTSTTHKIAAGKAAA